MTYAAAAQALCDGLHLDTPPVALAFVDAEPDDLPAPPGISPSACGFWRQAEQGAFYAPSEAHFNCPVGAHVMGFELPEQTGQQLMAAAEMMIGCGYLSADEVPNIPTLPGKPSGIAYAPLSESSRADLVLVWLSPREAMRFSEAAGACAWGRASVGGGRLLGRPACAALPTALQSGSATLSLGCAGMRTFTEISADRLLGAIPADRLDDFVAALQRTVEANAQMQRYYDGRKAEVASQSA